MKTKNLLRCVGAGFASVISACWLTMSETAQAHCDTEQGPVIREATAALEKGDVTPVLKWIKKDREAEVRDAFATAQTVRAKGLEARQLADRYFIETLVRLHRAGEGAAYSGIKRETTDPMISMADTALEKGSADELIQQISGHMGMVMRQKLERAIEASTRKNESVESGRKFVAAYVDYMHYVENVHAAIAMGKAEHAAPEAKGGGGHSHMH